MFMILEILICYLSMNGNGAEYWPLVQIIIKNGDLIYFVVKFKSFSANKLN